MKNLLFVLVTVTLLWAGLYLHGLSALELRGEEPRRVLPARAMLQSGDWVVPRSAGEVYNRKPPLLYWLIALSTRAFQRMDEFTARLPSAVSMLVLGLGVAWAAGRWLGTQAGLTAALFSLTNLGMLEKGRLAEIEALYVAAAGLSFVVWLAYWMRGQNFNAWVIGGLLSGLAWLAKGPVHLVYFYLIAGCIFHQTGRWRELRGRNHLLFLAAQMMVFLPWAVLNLRQTEGEAAGVWSDQLFHRLGLGNFDLTDYLLHAPQTFINFLPWSLLLFLVWNRRIMLFDSQYSEAERPVATGLKHGILLSVLVICLLPSSRPRFLLPLVTPASVALAWGLARTIPFMLQAPLRWWRRGVFVVAVLTLAALVSMPFFLQTGWSRPAWLAAVLLNLVVLRHVWQLRSPGASSTGALAVLTAGALVTGLAAGLWLAAPIFQSRERWRPLAREILALTDPEAEPDLIAHGLEPKLLVAQPFLFYLGRNCVEVSRKTKPGDLQRPVDWLLLPEEKWEKDEAKWTRRFGPPHFTAKIIPPERAAEGGFETPVMRLLRFGQPKEKPVKEPVNKEVQFRILPSQER